MRNLFEQFETVFGIGTDPDALSAGQILVRTILIYGLTLVTVRLGSKRFLSKASAFDVVVAIMLGSIMGRGIHGSIIATVIAGAALVGMHWLFGLLAFHTGWFGPLVKGERLLLIKDGKMRAEAMSKASITEHDLKQALRTKTDHHDLAKVKQAYLERNGEISIIPEQDEPHIIDVKVEDGVKSVRIELQ